MDVRNKFGLWRNRLKFYYKHRKHYWAIMLTLISQRRGFNEALFSRIYEHKIWSSGQTRSGKASGHDQTRRLAKGLRRIQAKYGLETLLDVACGDCAWQFKHELGFRKYIGVDIVESLIQQNQIRYSNRNARFLHLNILREIPPPTDLILCRDLIIHLTNRQIQQALSNLACTNSKYIAISTSPNTSYNQNIPAGDSRKVNLEAPPFNLPSPIEYLNDGLSSDSSRVVGLWRRSDLRNLSRE